MKLREVKLYFDIAVRVSKQSYAKRLQVGAVFVTESGLLSIGYNGTFPGCDNCCEFHSEAGSKTKDEVLHAEENVIGKLLEEGVSAKGGTLFLTHSPCIHCAKLLARAKIKEVMYLNAYRSDDGIHLLEKLGIKVTKFDYNDK